MSDRIMNSRKTRRRLAPSEKYEIFVSVLTGQATQREAAEKWKVDRSTVVHICRTAKQGALDALSASVPGRPGMTAEQAALAEAQRGARAAARHGHRAGGGAAPARGKSALGLTAGPVPARVDASVKAGLLDLVDHAAARTAGPARRACALLGLDHGGRHRWAARRAAGRLEDRPPGGHPLHGLLDWERAAIVGAVRGLGRDRPLATASWPTAARGSGWCTCRESTVRRVLAAEGLVLEGPPPREPAPRAPVAGLAGVEAQPDLGLRLHPLDPGPARLDRDPGRGLPQVAGHADQRGGDLHPGRGLLPRRAGRRGPARRRRPAGHRRAARGDRQRRPRHGRTT